ncbi:MAG: hypothetical protein AAFO94_16270, partial [Bacteroidota bacterium]
LSQNYRLTGAGDNIWFDSDAFYFVYRRMAGDFSLSAHFELGSLPADPLRKTGWMIRTSLAHDAQHASAVLHGDGLTLLQWRPGKGNRMKSPQHELYAPEAHYQTLKLKRSGAHISMYAAKGSGEAVHVGTHQLVGLPDTVFVGLLVCSHQPDTIATAIVSEVQIE